MRSTTGWKTPCSFINVNLNIKKIEAGYEKSHSLCRGSVRRGRIVRPNRGISADRSGWLLDRLDPIVNGHPKKLFLMIGTNDLAAGVSPEEVAANIGKLLDRFAEESPWTKIYVQSILPVNGVDTKAKAKNHWKKGAEIIEANKLIEALCEGRKNVLYIDVYSALVDQKGMLDQRYTNDGLHLMGEGYLAWKEVIEKYVK